MVNKKTKLVLTLVAVLWAVVWAGPYNESGINGYIGEDFKHANPLSDADAVINPIFSGWASGYCDYLPADEQWSGDWDDPLKALGAVTGDDFDIVSLGDLDENEIYASKQAGEITMTFGLSGEPCDKPICDVNGYDFVVFENDFLSTWNGGGAIYGEMFSELGYVEVSSDGINFLRFPSVSLTVNPPGPYGTIEVSDVYNFAGKHPNSNGICTGTPFDLQQLAGHALVINGTIDLSDIKYVRIVDVPGSGTFFDEAIKHIDPESCPVWDYYDFNNPIYDAWMTWGSAGFDLEAIGVLNSQDYAADINIDGTVDVEDLEVFIFSWLSCFGDENYISGCDIAMPKDLEVNFADFAIFAKQWQKTESWRLSHQYQQ